MEFTLWKSGETYILSVFVDHGAVAGELSILLDPGEADSLLENMDRLARKADAVKTNPGLFADETVELNDFE